MKNQLVRVLLLSIAIFLFSSLEASIGYQSHQIRIPSASEIRTMEKKLMTLVNKERDKHSLSPLVELDMLSKCAKKHSQNMAEGRVKFGHDGFEDRVKAVQKYARHNALGENVAYTYYIEHPLKTAVDGWMKSPSHRENILGDFQETGIGIVVSSEGRYYMTQLFAKKRK